MRKNHDLARACKKVLKSLLNCPHKRVVLRTERLEFRRPFFQVPLSRFNSERVRQASVTLAQKTFVDAFKLDLFSRNRVGDGCTTTATVLKVPASTRLRYD